jgi:hypothetical protein
LGLYRAWFSPDHPDFFNSSCLSEILVVPDGYVHTITGSSQSTSLSLIEIPGFARRLSRLQLVPPLAIPGPVEFIRESAFIGGARLREVMALANAHFLEIVLLTGCRLLSQLTIPASKEIIQGLSFVGRMGLNEITFLVDPRR